MGPDDSFAEFARRLGSGDQAAAAVVFRRFRRRLIALARSRLDARILRRVDPEDVVQSAYRSFFRRYGTGRGDFASWDEIWSLLSVITVGKSINRAEYHLAGCRTVEGEADGAAGSRDRLERIADHDPTPPQAAILSETLERILAGLGPEDRTAIEMSLQGYTTAEIAAHLDRGERTVRRLRRRIGERLMLLKDDGD